MTGQQASDDSFACRICGLSADFAGAGELAASGDALSDRPPNTVQLVLDLGRVPLANRLLRADQLDEDEPLYPLKLVFCTRCSLLQITETVAPEVLFREYVYFSSFSDTMLRHAEQLADQLIVKRNLTARSLVVEAGSNDGYLLQYFARRGISVLGVEPATNIAAVARDRGVATVSEFFSARLAARLRDQGPAADVFLANNVLAHVAHLNDFVEGIRVLIAPNGIAVMEVPYARDMIDRCEFDTIYHEHLCYFSLTALDTLFRSHGLVITDVERLAIHGGSLRVYVAPQGPALAGAAVTSLLEEERSHGLHRADFYHDFAQRVGRLKQSLHQLLVNLKRDGKRLAAYGAAAKGSTLLNFTGIGRELLEFVVDRSPHKQGRYMPGTHLRICEPAKLLQAMPDYVLLLTWNLSDEVLEQQAEYRRRGGKFIVPIPEVTIV